MSAQKRLIEIDLLSDSEENIPLKLPKKNEVVAQVEPSSSVSAAVIEQLMIGTYLLTYLLTYALTHSLIYQGIECPICLSTQAYSHALPSCGCTFCYVCIAVSNSLLPIHSFTHSLTYLLTYLLTHSFRIGGIKRTIHARCAKPNII